MDDIIVHRTCDMKRAEKSKIRRNISLNDYQEDDNEGIGE